MYEKKSRSVEYPRRSRVVYDKKTGEIVHLHHVIVLEGAQAPTDAEIDEQCISLAQRDLAVMSVKYEDLKTSNLYAVDVEANALKEISQVK